MGKTFSCDFPNCSFVCSKHSEFKKHIVGHKDPSKLYRCDESNCDFTTLDRRNLKEHKNTHANSRPHKCDQIVDGKPCSFSTNGVSALCKHRRVKHNITGPSRSKGPRKPKALHSEVDTHAGVLYEHTFLAAPSRAVSSHPQTHHATPSHVPGATSPPASTEHPSSNNYPSAPGTYYGQGSNHESFDLTASSAGASSSVVSQNSHWNASAVVPMSSPVFQYSTNNTVLTSNVATYTTLPISPYPATSLNAGSTSTSFGPVASYNNNSHYYPDSAISYNSFPTSNALSNYTFPVRGEAFNNGADTLAHWQGSADVKPGLSSHHNFVGRYVPATLPLLYNHATASIPNTFYTQATSIHSTQIPPRSLYSSLSGALGTDSESTRSISVGTPCLTEDSSISPESCTNLSPSPCAEPEPCDNACAGPVTPPDDGAKDIRCASTFAVDPINVDALDTPDDSCASHDASLMAPPSSCIPPVPQEVLDDDDGASDLTEYMRPFPKSFLEELYDDEIFYQGTDHKGCLYPDMMVNAGIEGWDKSVLDE